MRGMFEFAQTKLIEELQYSQISMYTTVAHRGGIGLVALR